jgi:NAD(P)-dependent dehydrogenase (short-subunit alcohol dehydrogenase family)
MSFKTALVTGGARGIGAAISKFLAVRGTNVIVNYLSHKEFAEQVVSEIKARKDTAGRVDGDDSSSIGTYGDALAIQADVRDAKQVQRMVDQVIKNSLAISISWLAMPMSASISSSLF